MFTVGMNGGERQTGILSISITSCQQGIDEANRFSRD